MTITITESVRLILGTLEITPTGAVTDSISVAESVSVFPTVLFIGPTDTIAMVESIAITLTVGTATFPIELFRRPNTLLRM